MHGVMEYVLSGSNGSNHKIMICDGRMHDLPWDPLGVQSRNEQTVTQNVNSEKSFPFVSELQLFASCKLVALVIQQAAHLMRW